MRLTIFWRVILAQTMLIALALAVSLYALSQLRWLTSLSTDILATDTACIKEEKHLLRLFLAQIRNDKKDILDQKLYEPFAQRHKSFEAALERVATLLDTSQEQVRLEQIRHLHARYGSSLMAAFARTGSWNRDKEEISDRIIGEINALIGFREEAIARKTTLARDQATVAAHMVGWLTLGGLSMAICLTYFHARGVSRPLQKLAQELRRVGWGEFRRSLDLRGPKEVRALAQTFNWMAESLAELDQMKTDFIAHVSHDLRTPLTGIREGTALLLEGTPEPVTPAQREILEIVRSHSERLCHSISAILDLSKMEAGMMEYLRAPCDLVDLIGKSVEMVHLMAQKKQLRLEVTQTSVLPLLAIDAERIQQVLTNLLSNAVKFTPPGGTIGIAATAQENKESWKTWVEVRVTDTGVGIQAEEVERIFDRFYQSPSHRGRHQQGTGLGLAIARHIVEAHGGKIWVESKVEEGTTFVFTLPVESNDAAKAVLVAYRRGGENGA
jgi:two-component system sensor histidine kinase GlrK